MAAEPLVSVLTPSFNQAKWLEDNLRSVASQSYARIEHVVVDGGSFDGSVEVLENASERVRWVSEKDRGQSNALNKAFALSKGEIIGWLNSDDAYYDSRAVETAVEFFKRNPDADVAYGHAARVDADGRIVYFMYAPRFAYWRLKWGCFLIQPAVFIRRRAIEKQFVDESFHYAMDWELWLRLAQACRFHRIDRVLAIDRTHPGRKIKTWGDVLEKDTERLAASYGVGRPWYFRLVDAPLSVLGRLWAARFVASAREGLVFGGGQDSTLRLLRRQIATRLSTLPEEMQ